jgi:uncharacterized protein (DUF983 family)
MSLSAVLFIVFLVLKLVGVIAWSWWWVTAPLWLNFVAGVVMFAILVVVSGRNHKVAGKILNDSTKKWNRLF